MSHCTAGSRKPTLLMCRRHVTQGFVTQGAVKQLQWSASLFERSYGPIICVLWKRHCHTGCMQMSSLLYGRGYATSAVLKSWKLSHTGDSWRVSRVCGKTCVTSSDLTCRMSFCTECTVSSLLFGRGCVPSAHLCGQTCVFSSDLTYKKSFHTMYRQTAFILSTQI